jgi:MFS family permease
MTQPPRAATHLSKEAGADCGNAYALYALFLLCLANAFNLGDRLLLGVVQEPIRLEFGLSDFQLGLLGGPAFAVLYALLSIPIARIADRANRITIGSIALGVWSGLTAVCGLAGSYVQLLIARVGVSVGEAGAAPPALSYISDIFRPERRATAMAVFAIGGPAGALIATTLGGRIAQDLGWRWAFIIFGIAGTVLAVVIRLTLCEVRHAGTRPAPIAFGDAIRHLASRRSYVHVCAGGVFAAFSANFIMQYMTSFLMRVHELPIARASVIVGLAGGLFGMIGAFSGGYLADMVSRRRPAARTLVVAVAFTLAAFGFTLAFWTPLAVAIPLLLFSSFCMNTYPGVSFAVSSAVAPPAIRAMSIAIFTLAGNLIGYSLGPPILGAISDWAAARELARGGVDAAQCVADLAPALCAQSRGAGLRWALTIGALLLLGGSWHYFRASRTLEQDIER